MNPSRNQAKFHSIVLTEENPVDRYHFEESVSKVLRSRFKDSSIFIEYRHGIGGKIRNFMDCLEIIEEVYGDIGNTSFKMQKMGNEKTGNLVIMTWKNVNRFQMNLQQ